MSRLLAAAALLAGCAVTSADGTLAGGTSTDRSSVDGPALLGDAPGADLAPLRAGVAAALSRGQVAFGAPDPRAEPTLSVLPPRLGPFEQRSAALPAVYDLRLRGGACVLVARDGEVVPLPNVPCRPAG